MPFRVATITCWPVAVSTVKATHGLPALSTATEGRPSGPAWVNGGLLGYTCEAVNVGEPLAYQMPSVPAHTTCFPPVASSAMSVPFVFFAVAPMREGTGNGPYAM